MARVQIDLPEHLPFSTDLPLYASHMNYGNHLDNALLLTVVSEARIRFIAAMGFSEMNIEGAGIIVADAAVQYRSEAHHGETMRVAMGAQAFWARGCDLVWTMDDAASGRRVAHGKTGIVFFDYQAGRAVDVPAGFRQKAGAAPGAD